MLTNASISAHMNLERRSKLGFTTFFSQKVQLCGTCVQLTGQAINTLLNYILNAGVVGGCSKVCSALKKKAEETVCDLVCIVVGVEQFAKAIEKADLDPIYLCELLNICKPDDNGAGTLDSVTVTPLSGNQGDKFTGQMDCTVTNHTGAGEFAFGISGGVDMPSGAGSLYPELDPGSYQVKVDIDTTPTFDPDSGDGSQWVPGVYTLEAEFCMGECGSKHPHSKVFGDMSTNFTLN